MALDFIKRIRKPKNGARKLTGRCLLFALLMLAGLPGSGRAQKPDDTIRVETELAAFEVTVTDKNGSPVRGLDAKDFKIYENGVERPIDFFEPIRKKNENRPLSIVFALDVSGSMTSEELVELQAAMRKFVKRLADYNSYFAVMTFGMNVKTVQSFTNKPDKLEKTFDKILRDQDGLSTHAYDAVDEAVRMLRKKSPPTLKNQLPRRAVILITDGFPVGDTVSPKTVIERANDAETTVYSILLPSFSRLQGTKKPLLTLLEASGLIEKTGGKSFYVNDNNFEPLFQSLEEEITSTYVLAFYPSEENRKDGKFHEVRIETSKNLQIRQNRNGYQLK
ncbi:MAG: VWA domain-containing protein [Acidobacteria bacterium]|nr:VWA domain-containing protein [Acidobacteriota bacterium]